jgi:general secretion pathway protein D
MDMRVPQSGAFVVAVLLAALAPAGAAEVPVAVSAPQATVNFTFSQVEVRTFVRLIGELTGRRFIVDEAVKGQITILAPRVPVGEAYPLFVKVLESVGCAVVEEDGLSRVVVLAPRTLPAAPVIGEDGKVSGLGLITRVLRLKNTSVGDLRKVLDALVGREKGGTITLLEASNHLVITDTAENVRRFEQVIAEIDKAGVGTTSEVVFLKFADASEFVQQYNAAAGARERVTREGVPARSGKDLALLAVPQSNSIVLIGPAGDIAAVRKILALIDVETTAGHGNLHALFLRHLSAEEAAKNINALLERSLGKDPPKGGERRRLAVEANPANNALLIDASPMDFQLVKTLVEQLDQVQQQVLIEVVIAEVSAEEGLDVGVEFAALNMPDAVGNTVVQGGSRLSEGTESLMNSVQNGVFPRGITVGVARGRRVDAAGNVVADYPAVLNLNALQKKGKVRILSSVPLVSQNNKEATVNVVNNVPILKSTIQGGSGTSRDVIQNIERVDVGIKLKLTPHINPSNEVSMVLNPSIEAIIDQGPTGTQFTPTIAKREVSTTVTVPDGRTIVLSGLIREDRSNVVRKVPILGSIPLIGILFRHTVENTERTNLIIFVTPRVMNGEAGARAMTEDWSRRTGLSTTNADTAVAAPAGR